MTTTKILNAAADLLDRPGAWCQEAYARDADGYSTHPLADKAVSWCPIGAITRVAEESDVQDYHEAQARLTTTVQRRHQNISHWNDDPNRTQSEVVAMLRRAAEEET